MWAHHLQNAVKDFKEEKTLYAKVVVILLLSKGRALYIVVTPADKKLTVGVLQILQVFQRSTWNNRNAI